jgi:hypothetical protein
MGEWGGAQIENCVVIGSQGICGLSIEALFPMSTMTRVQMDPPPSGDMWSSLGFSEEAEYIRVRHNVDLVVVQSVDSVLTIQIREQIRNLIRDVGVMGVTVILGVSGSDDILDCVEFQPVMAELRARFVLCRGMPGGVAISYGEGSENSRAAREIGELIAAAGIETVACGMELIAGPGGVTVPASGQPRVLVARSGFELMVSLMSGRALTAAWLGDAGFREVPDRCFAECGSLMLALLPCECERLGTEAFRGCIRLKEIQLDNVREIGALAFWGCCALLRVGSVANVVSMGNGAFAGVAVRELSFASLGSISDFAFMGSELRVLMVGTGKNQSGAWRLPFENCRYLQQLEVWPGGGGCLLGLVGNVPQEIRFHADLREAERAFGDLLRGSRTKVVVIADDGQIAGGPRSAAFVPADAGPPLMAIPHSSDIRSVRTRSVNLSVLPPGHLRGALSGGIWIETVTLPTWLERLPDRFFDECRSLRFVNPGECPRLRVIGGYCFYGCVSLRRVDFPASLCDVHSMAFWGSGIEELNFVPASNLRGAGGACARWVRRVSLPFGFRSSLGLGGSWRAADLSCGTSHVRGMPLLCRLRFTGVRGISSDWASCASSSAWVTSELAAPARRNGFPALPV